MSKSYKEKLQEFYEDLKDSYGITYDNVESIKPSGLELQPTKYQRKCKSEVIDVYDVLTAFEVVNPAIQHAVKKLLAPGKRGYKDVEQDLLEAIASIRRAIELEHGKETK